MLTTCFYWFGLLFREERRHIVRLLAQKFTHSLAANDQKRAELFTLVIKA